MRTTGRLDDVLLDVSMKTRIIVLLAGALLTVACGSRWEQSTAQNKDSAQAATASREGSLKADAPAQTPGAATTPRETAPPPPPPPPQPKTYTIEAGTLISVQTIDAVDTKNTTTEDEFEGTLGSAIVVDGKTLAKPGTSVIGVVTNADKGGKTKRKASLTLSLSRILLDDWRIPVDRTNTVTQVAKSDTKKNMVRTGILAGGGAAIGAIAGGGKGAAIGAAIGGGAGVTTNLATKGPAATIPAGSVLSFTMTQPASVTIQP